MDTIIEEIKSKENIEGYWDFKENDKKDHVHSLIKYPAIMVPNMQGEIFDIILKHDTNIKNVLDPFMGSGTIPVEALIRGLNAYGIDINPLSFLMVKVKTQDYDLNILNKKIESIIKTIETLQDYLLIKFVGINKWYKQQVINDLSRIRFAICLENDLKIRQFFWVAFADIAKQVDNSRTSTFKLHIKEQERIDAFESNTLTLFINKLVSNYNSLVDFKKKIGSVKAEVFLGDSKEILNNDKLIDSVDLILTSPPYGDNATTITYGQYSVLPLRWIPLSDISESLNEDYINTLSYIDRISLGGINYAVEKILSSNILNKSESLMNIWNDLVNSEKLSKAQKVASFIMDFFDILKSMSKVLKKGKLLVLTVGNRTVNKKEVPFDTIIQELAASISLELVYNFRRNILKNKNFSDTKVQNFKTISKETIIIFKKT